MLMSEPACFIKKTARLYLGSPQRKSQVDVLLEFIKTLLVHQNPADKFKELAGLVDDVFQLVHSGKHIVGRNLVCIDPIASLQCRAAE